jgi:hypothetical protein
MQAQRTHIGRCMVAQWTRGVPQALTNHSAISGSVGMRLREQTAPKPW